MDVKYFSIIVPCYNEEHRIASTVNKLKEFLVMNPGSEVIFVDDGSIDKTVKIIERYRCSNMHILELASNIGKWGAICAGAEFAKRDYVFMCDADFSVDLNHLIPRLSLVENSVIIGNRYNAMNDIPSKRRIPGRIFNFLARKIVGINYVDTQTPMKGWHNTPTMKKIFNEMVETGFSGDVEFLYRCDKLKVQVHTIDIKYVFVEGSSVNVKKHAWPMFLALLRVRENVK